METIKESHLVKTRKDHKCHGCCRKILKGETASSFTGKEDYIYTIHTCDKCEEFISLVENKEAVNDMYMDGLTTEGWVLEFSDYKSYLKK